MNVEVEQDIQSQAVNGAFYYSARGRVLQINDLHTNEEAAYGCNKLLMIESDQGASFNFHVSPETYFIDPVKIKVGDYVIGFYAANAPALMVYPPQFCVTAMALDRDGRHIKVDRFDQNLVSADGQLKLLPAAGTDIILVNHQPFYGDIKNRNLIVEYTVTTRSIPAQTVPDKIIVLCNRNVVC